MRDVRIALLVLTALLTACYVKGTANVRVGAVCHERKDCESVCWEGSCTILCQTAADCPRVPEVPAPMTCIDGNVCVFACARQDECGGWECTGKRRNESDERVLVCIPNFGGDDPEDVDPDPPVDEPPASADRP